MQKFNSIFWQTSGVLLLCLTTANLSQAQITPDETLPENSTVKQNIREGLPSDDIEGGTQRGGNLFHSFSDFNVKEGRGAYFANPAGVNNILTRVTGGNGSNIFGTLGVLGGANLFLINPSGIIFGPNAQLKIDGSFIGSTADRINFDNGKFFSATETSSLLTINIPKGLQFRDNPGKIVNQSRVGNPMLPEGLQVQSGKTLALVGGDVSFEGGALSAPSGRIELASVGSNSFVSLNPVTEGWSLGFEGVQNFQNITLSPSSIQTSSTRLENSIFKPSGNIFLTGKNIIINQSQILSSNQGIGKSGSIYITTSESLLVNSSLINANNRVNNGISGNIVITTKKLTVQQSRLDSSAQRAQGRPTNGQGGDIKIDASEFVEVNGNGGVSELTTVTFGSGKAGDIQIITRQLMLSNGGRINSSTENLGQGGNININASEFVQVTGTGITKTPTGTQVINSGIFAVANQKITGNAGDINITTPSLLLNNQARISTSTNGQGNAGNIQINTRELSLKTGGQIGSSTISSGNGGNLTVNVSELIEISSQASPTEPVVSGIFARTVGKGATGNGGTINVNTNRLLIRDKGIITAAAVEGSTGQAGNLTIDASKLTLQNEATISASTISSQGGNISLNLRTLDITNDTEISASTESGQAGNLNINATDSINLNQGSRLTVEATGNGTSGNLFLTTPQLTLQNGSKISAETTSGIGGNIQINLQNLNVTRQSDITASTNTGKAGDLNIYATDSVNVNRGSGLSVEAKNGTAGNLTLTANSLNLNQGTITAETQKPEDESANIRLRVADIIKLRNESEISATSTGIANGGNITINTRFLIADPPEGSNGSDITADSRGGAGGKIDITAQGVFGTQIRDNPTNDNDITAISEQNPDLNGVINFNTPDIDPSRGLVQFSTVVINPTTLINQDPCIKQDESRLVISRRGGLPPSIIENISDRAIEIELVKPVNSPNQPQNRTKKPKSTTQEPIIPARGWVSNGDGKVVLTAYDPTAKAPQRYQKNESVCPAQ